MPLKLNSFRDTNQQIWVACCECTRGGNGNSKDGCSSGRRCKKWNGMGCFSGELLEKLRGIL